jgi:uncharacterized membrane protein YdbT with pleckstrin-like domain
VILVLIILIVLVAVAYQTAGENHDAARAELSKQKEAMNKQEMLLSQTKDKSETGDKSLDSTNKDQKSRIDSLAAKLD